MNAREWLNVLAILNSIDEVPGMPVVIQMDVAPKDHLALLHLKDTMRRNRNAAFRADPVKFFRRADEDTQAAIWAEVERRLAGSA